MAQQTINIGAAANDGTGDPARTAFDKVNDNFDELYSGIIPTDRPFKLEPFNAEHTYFALYVGDGGTYLGHNDESVNLGYNFGNYDATEPRCHFTQECDYWVTRNGSNIRTIEVYWQGTGADSLVGGSVTSHSVRPFFWSFAPDDTSQDHTGELIYGFIQTGPYRFLDGGGFSITSGEDNTSGNIVGFDVDGMHVVKPLMVQAAPPLPVTAATTTSTCQFTVATGHGYFAGSNISLWGSLDGEPELLVSGNVTEVTSTTITTDINNTGAAYIPASPTAGVYGVKRPVPTTATSIMTQTLGVNRSVMSGDTNTFSVAGPSSLFGRLYINDVGMSGGAGSGATLNINKLNTYNQALTFNNNSGAYAFGWINASNASFCIGPRQTTDSDFTAANSHITLTTSNGKQCVGFSGALSNVGALVRIAAGSTTHAQLQLNAGTLKTSVLNGALEYDGTNLYFTTGGTRYTVSLV